MKCVLTRHESHTHCGRTDLIMSRYSRPVLVLLNVRLDNLFRLALGLDLVYTCFLTFPAGDIYHFITHFIAHTLEG